MRGGSGVGRLWEVKEITTIESVPAYNSKRRDSAESISLWQIVAWYHTTNESTMDCFFQGGDHNGKSYARD